MIKLVFFFLLLMISSCGKSSNAQTNQPLIFLHYWSDDLGAGIDTMMQAFSSMNKGYTIKASGFDHESYKVSIKVMLAGGNPPDLFSYWAGARTNALVKSDYLEPLTDVWKKHSIDDAISPMVANACKYKGVPYVLPVAQHYVAFFYNKHVFQKNGIHPPKTWNEFTAVCQTLKSNGVTPIDLGARDLWPAQFWFDYLLLRTAGPGFRDSLMSGTASYSDPKVMKSFELWKELIESNYFRKDAVNRDWAEAGRSVASGDAAMTLMGTWIIGMFDNQFKLKQGIDYDYFSFPTIDESIPVVALGPIDGILLPKAGNTKKAKDVIASFTQIEVQRAMSVGSGALSPAVSVVPSDNLPIQKKIHSELKGVDYWAFNFDLAAEPVIAEKGLTLFGEFLKTPTSYPLLLENLQSEVAK